MVPPYTDDPFLAADPSKWTSTGSLQYGATGLAAYATSGTLRSVVGGTFEEVNLNLTFAASGGTYTAYLLAGSTDLATSNLYALEVTEPIVDATNCWALTRFWKRVNGQETTLNSFYQNCRINGRNQMSLRAMVRPGLQIVWVTPTQGNVSFDYDPNILGGNSGLGLANTPPGNTITRAQLIHGESAAPPAPNRSSFGITTYPNRIEMQWAGVSDGPTGSGVFGYAILRDGNYIGCAITPQFIDDAVSPGVTYNYSVIVQDNYGNYGAPTIVPVTAAPIGSVDSRRTGVRNNAAYWGAAGENIDVFSGNLNFTLPLIQAQARNGWGATFALSYDSQIWRKDPAGVWRFGGDSGYGYGWRLQAGSITPSWRDNFNLDHYTYKDASGAEYRLDIQRGEGTWMSSQGTYVAYDALQSRLYFPDGSFCELRSFYNGTCPGREYYEQAMWMAEAYRFLNSDWVYSTPYTPYMYQYNYPYYYWPSYAPGYGI